MKNLFALLVLGVSTLASAVPVAGNQLEKNSPTEQPFEGILGGLGKGIDVALDESLNPVVEAEGAVVDTAVNLLAIPARSLADKRGLLDVVPNAGYEPSPAVKAAIHELALAIEAEQGAKSKRSNEKRDWLADLALIIGVVGELEPVVLPLIAAA